MVSLKGWMEPGPISGAPLRMGGFGFFFPSVSSQSMGALIKRANVDFLFLFVAEAKGQVGKTTPQIKLVF